MCAPQWGVKDGRSRTFRSSDPRSLAGQSAPPGWRRYPTDWSPAAVATSLSAGDSGNKAQARLL